MSSVLARARGLAPTCQRQLARGLCQPARLATSTRHVRRYHEDGEKATESKKQGGGFGIRKFITPSSDLQTRDTLIAAEEERIQEFDQFHRRHIGPRDSEIPGMLQTVGLEGRTLDEFIQEVIPGDILQTHDRDINKDTTQKGERHIRKSLDDLLESNVKNTWLNGGGYYPVHTPTVIKRNLFENPAWYTSYTPYQAEISQGRMESLLNFQTMVSDLTGLPVANASLLDEGTAAAEAMTLSLNALPSSRSKSPNKVFAISSGLHKNTKQVLRGRAEAFGIELKELDFNEPTVFESLDAFGPALIGAMIQYPDTYGRVHDYRKLAEKTKELGVLLSVATDLSALTVLTPPGEWGADIAFGNSQRFGVPLGNGGPHAAFFAVKDAQKRRLPGRLIGVTKDRLGRPALRLALQTREQHIRREKATSNVCTAQALLANIAAMYAVYHGPAQLKAMAVENIRFARIVASLAQSYGYEVVGSPDAKDNAILSDTFALRFAKRDDALLLVKALKKNQIGARMDLPPNDAIYVSFSLSNNLDTTLYQRLWSSFNIAKSGAKAEQSPLDGSIFLEGLKVTDEAVLESLPDFARRQSSYLTHPVFNTHHSETEMLRYLHHLQSKDLSQVHSMIPLGSCTMKLNPTSAMELIGAGPISDVHPLAPGSTLKGYNALINELKKQLSALTGMHSSSVQPNSGAQGEFAGLRVIRKYLQSTPGGEKRDICLIPVSAHGTNPASAAMVGMRTVPIKCDAATGNLDLEDLKAKCQKHKDELGAIMITYPSTYGVFEPYVKNVCQIVHDHGGLVYMDGANMNAQIGLMSPGELGADICHLNLHKTFCIPHGGGGPGVGPICAVERLTPFLPGGEHGIDRVSSANEGSASILPISWAYIAMMCKSFFYNTVLFPSSLTQLLTCFFCSRKGASKGHQAGPPQRQLPPRPP